MSRARLWAIAFLVSAATALSSAPALAQGSTPCEALLDHALQGYRTSLPRLRQYAWGDVRARGAGQATTMRSDSVAWYQDIARFDMVGNVQFRDTTVMLDADSARYFLNDERLEAYGRVRLVNLSNGTILTGPNLTYWRAVPSLRNTTELLPTGRPTVRYHGTADTAGVEPYLIIGDAVRLRGTDDAWAAGDVQIDRSDFHAAADSAILGLVSNRGHLIGHARVNGGGADSSSYHLRGRDVAFTSLDDRLNWVQARDSAHAESSDFTITADTVEFTIVDDMVQGGFAWGSSIETRAVSSTNTITADSLAIDSPNQKLEQLRAFGSARAVSVQDSLDEDPDWIVGDSLIANFSETEWEQRYLDTLIAFGNAAAFYRMYSVAGGDVPDINSSRGDMIRAVFTVVGLSKVDVRGNTDGVHLQRRRTRQQL